jgi:hypothetical protein
MTFTYTPNSPNDITRVRFHIADTVESSAMYSDEEITFGIAEGGSYQQAVIILLQNLIARLSAEPDFTADWLRVDNRRSVEGYRVLLQEKRRQFGISAVRARGKAVYRSDSGQTEAPEEW